MDSVRKKASEKNILIKDIHLCQFDETQDYGAFLFVENFKLLKELLKKYGLQLVHRDTYKSWSTCLHLTDAGRDKFDQRKSNASEHIKIYNKTVHPLFACTSV